MNSKEFVAALSDLCGVSVKDTNLLVKGLVSVMSEQLEIGNSVNVPNFGTFDVKKKLERVFVNPISKQKMLIPPKMVIGFKTSPSLKDKINK